MSLQKSDLPPDTSTTPPRRKSDQPNQEHTPTGSHSRVAQGNQSATPIDTSHHQNSSAAERVPLSPFPDHDSGYNSSNNDKHLHSNNQPDRSPQHHAHPQHVSRRSAGKYRTQSVIESNRRKHAEGLEYAPARRFSNDIGRGRATEFEVYVDETYTALIEREDTDRNIQITVEDKGPKWINLGTLASEGFFKRDIRTTYHLSNLLQELYLAKEKGLKRIVLSEDRINENPVSRLSRIIKDDFWQNLTRRIDGSNAAVVGRDPKDWTTHPRPRIYIPVGAPEQHAYYTRIAREHPEVDLDVRWLSQDPSNEEYVRDLNEAPGLLALEMERIQDTKHGEANFRGLPFVVPGGRFNELYGWDSYMESLGLIIHNKHHLAMNMVKHFCFCIKHYGKILNANRTYYLCRTQPPFLTDMAIRIYKKMNKHDELTKDFLRTAILAAVKEYYTVWMSPPRYDPESGLSRYRAQGLGVPPETEATHFEHILTPYAQKHGLSYKDFIHAYNYGKLHEPELDKFFLHDRAVRESGHDTSYRLENVGADLAVVDLNSCLYKYEMDIAHIIATEFDGHLTITSDFATPNSPKGHIETPEAWLSRAALRKERMDKHMWDESKGMFFDYNCALKTQTGYESATTFWAMWAGVASPEQADKMVTHALPRFEVGGGLVSGTESSRGAISLSRPNRQWDYPFGWAPQQILAWHGFQRYGYEKEAKRLAYRWLFMVTKAFVDFNGVVVEKYNVTDPRRPHVVAAEYGNQGSDFKGAPKEGFGWVNASYVVGLEILDEPMRRRLGALASWDEYKEKKTPRHRASSMQIPSHDEHQPTTQAKDQHDHEDTHSGAKVHESEQTVTHPMALKNEPAAHGDITPARYGGGSVAEPSIASHGHAHPPSMFFQVDGAGDWKGTSVF